MAILLLLLVTAVGATLLFPAAAARAFVMNEEGATRWACGGRADGRPERRIFAFPEEP